MTDPVTLIRALRTFQDQAVDARAGAGARIAPARQAQQQLDSAWAKLSAEVDLAGNAVQHLGAKLERERRYLDPTEELVSGAEEAARRGQLRSSRVLEVAGRMLERCRRRWEEAQQELLLIDQQLQTCKAAKRRRLLERRSQVVADLERCSNAVMACEQASELASQAQSDALRADQGADESRQSLEEAQGAMVRAETAHCKADGRWQVAAQACQQGLDQAAAAREQLVVQEHAAQLVFDKAVALDSALEDSVEVLIELDRGNL